MSSALDLANWIRARYGRAEPLTHLKLQKLAFYCYGAALAHSEAALGAIRFEAWDHGPVSREIWSVYRDCGSGPVTGPLSGEAVPSYAPATVRVLDDVLAVYAPLSAWRIRQESHLETPWREAYETPSRIIAEDRLRQHFKEKFAPGCVRYPEHLAGTGSFSLDRIPVRAFGSLHELALAVARAT